MKRNLGHLEVAGSDVKTGYEWLRLKWVRMGLKLVRMDLKWVRMGLK
jgi:hypothetical protein